MLGSGATGTVYGGVAQDGERLAVKVLRHELSADDLYVRRFLHESRAARSIDHPYLVPIYAAGEEGGRHFMLMPELKGRSLSDLLGEGARGVAATLRMVQQVAAALDVLHAKGFVHRDIKPSNIIVRDDTGDHVLTDFGLVKGAAYTVLTRSGEVLGTLDYLAPECIEGAPATPQSDLYGLGCTAFASVTGAPPFHGRGIVALSLAHLGEEPPDPHKDGHCGPEFSLALRSALAKDPVRRPPSADSYFRTLRIASMVPRR